MAIVKVKHSLSYLWGFEKLYFEKNQRCCFYMKDFVPQLLSGHVSFTISFTIAELVG